MRTPGLIACTLLAACNFHYSASTSTGGAASSSGSSATDDAAAFKAGGSYAVQKNQVLRGRTRVDADPKNADAVDEYATAIMQVYNTNQHESDTSVNWDEHADHAVRLAKEAGASASTPERKAHFGFVQGVLLKHRHKTDDALATFDQILATQPQNTEVVGWMLEIYSAQKAPPAANEKLCKRTRRSLTEQAKINELIGLCAQWHPKREQVDPILDLATLVPWVNPPELKTYKRALGENQCGGEKLAECMSSCHCDPAEVRCRCKEQCKLDKNNCLVPYLH
jgi:hypothetical protein